MSNNNMSKGIIIICLNRKKWLTTLIMMMTIISVLIRMIVAKRPLPTVAVAFQSHVVCLPFLSCFFLEQYAKLSSQAQLIWFTTPKMLLKVTLQGWRQYTSAGFRQVTNSLGGFARRTPRRTGNVLYGEPIKC